MRNLSFIIITLILLAGCRQHIIQYPVSYKNNEDKFMEFSQDLNKRILEEDNEIIQEYIDSLGLDLTRNGYGFWLDKPEEATISMAKAGDAVRYKYEVEDFEGNVIYGWEENGEQAIVLGRAELPRGLHFSLQLIEEGDSAIAMVPSPLAYGSYGDRDKIGPYQPLIYKIYMMNIEKNRK